MLGGAKKGRQRELEGNWKISELAKEGEESVNVEMARERGESVSVQLDERGKKECLYSWVGGKEEGSWLFWLAVIRRHWVFKT